MIVSKLCTCVMPMLLFWELQCLGKLAASKDLCSKEGREGLSGVTCCVGGLVAWAKIS